MALKAWSYQTDLGFTLRGWFSEPTGKPLLHFLHGNGFCGLTYWPMLALLEEHFDLWISDVQGHGGSDSGERFVGWNESARLAEKAFRAHRLFWDVPRYALGHSFGGVVSALMASQTPKLFSRLVMLDPVLFTPKILWLKQLLNAVGQKNRLPMVQAALKRRAHWPSADEAYQALRGRGIYRGWQPEAHQAFIQSALKTLPDGSVELKCPPWLEAQIFASSPEKLWPSLQKIHVPTKVLYGDKTYPFVEQAALRFQAKNAFVELQKCQGGHCFMQEDPAYTAQEIVRFLRVI